MSRYLHEFRFKQSDGTWSNWLPYLQASPPTEGEVELRTRERLGSRPWYLKPVDTPQHNDGQRHALQAVDETGRNLSGLIDFYRHGCILSHQQFTPDPQLLAKAHQHFQQAITLLKEAIETAT